MQTGSKIYSALVIVLLSTFLFYSFLTNKSPAYRFSYKQAGLTERQAAAHLLSRFTYGAKTGDVDEVIKAGLENWFQQQLDAQYADKELNQLLSSYDAINLSNTDVVTKYPQGNKVYRMAIADGFINKDSVNKSDRSYKNKIDEYMLKKGLKPQQELFRQLISQKVIRAAYTDNQLQELLTDFWFNHFNVALNKNQCAEFIPAYERDVIRPNVLGSFENLVLSTAKSPAMLMYLDNFSSVGAANEEMAKPVKTINNNKVLANRSQLLNDSTTQKNQALKKVQQIKNIKGLNENYAREVMELHTLGVDGGYTQSDVTQAARILTGWTVYPMDENSALRKTLDKMGEDTFKARGFLRDGDFLFAANRHDSNEKIVLGEKFPAGGGYEEGVKLLKMLANHPATAQFISRKIAIRFVNDNPPQSLVNKMTKTFTSRGGDIKQVLITMVSAPEFWSKEALREKTKSPFELAISAVRSLDADIKMPYQLYTWVSKMGQRMYYYQAPTGFPDKGQYWINTGALLSRMNFGLALASQKIPGVKINLAAINKNREPESGQAALVTYSRLMMPERDLNQTIQRLTPMLTDPNLLTKVEQAAVKTAPVQDMNSMINERDIMDLDKAEKSVQNKDVLKKATNASASNNAMLAQVVGVIIGSPEFQRK